MSVVVVTRNIDEHIARLRRTSAGLRELGGSSVVVGPDAEQNVKAAVLARKGFAPLAREALEAEARRTMAAEASAITRGDTAGIWQRVGASLVELVRRRWGTESLAVTTNYAERKRREGYGSTPGVRTGALRDSIAAREETR